MPRNGSGTYTPPTNSWSPAVNGNSATPADFNSLRDDIASALSQSISADGQTPVTADIPMDNNKITGLAQGTASGDALAWEQLFSQGVEADVASAATCDIGAVKSTFIRITGTSTISSFGTNYNGPRYIRFAGALQLTHNGTTLILPGGANITTAAGDCAIVRPIGSPSSGWAIVAYQRGFVGDYATLGENTFTGAQTLPGDAVNDLEAIPKQQLDDGLATKADLAGDSGQTFAVAGATDVTHAVNLGQFVAALSGSDFSIDIPCTGLPSGATVLTVKVGKLTSAADNSYTTVTFPTAFTNACIAAFVTTVRGAALSGDGVVASFASVIDKTQIGIGVCINVAISSPDVQWVAIGY